MPQITRGYVLDKLSPPTKAQIYFHQEVMPKLIDTVSAAEMAVQTLAGMTRRQPVLAVGAALGAGYALCVAFRRGSSAKAGRYLSD